MGHTTARGDRRQPPATDPERHEPPRGLPIAGNVKVPVLDHPLVIGIGDARLATTGLASAQLGDGIGREFVDDPR